MSISAEAEDVEAIADALLLVDAAAVAAADLLLLLIVWLLTFAEFAD